MIRNVKPGVFPIAWTDDEIEVSEENVEKIKSGKMLAKIAYILPLVCLSIGFVVFVLVISLLICQILKNRKAKQIKLKYETKQ